MTVSIAIDGPAGSGKSSAAKGLARRLGIEYIDTGAMYRAIAWWMLTNGVDVDDPARVAEHATDPEIMIGGDPDHPIVEVDGVDVTGPIRESSVSDAVSRVSAVAQVRHRLVEVQREMVARAHRSGRGVVMEGRDIGTVVLPDATVKVFLTADVDVRASRRAAENQQRENSSADAERHLQAARANLVDRDSTDSSRAVSPLVKADDAVEIDATSMTLDEVIDAIAALVPREG